MLDYIDNMLRQLLITKVPGITSPLQVRFQPPDDDWRTYVSTLGQLALNVYLVEMKENREMRLTGRTRTVNGGNITETPRPRFVDVHYLITAWDPATPQPAVEPNIVEHELLWDVTSALMDADPLDPTDIYAPSPLPAGFPTLIQSAELPTTVLPPEGFGKHAEFWGTMPGSNNPWRPSVLLILTLPVTMAPYATYPMVTTRITEYDAPAGSGKEVWVEIGGTVSNATASPAVPVAGASVAIFNTSGVQLAATTTDSQGRFIFNLLRPGNYQLQFAAASFPAPPPRNITVPSPTGEYNLQFT
jgi:Pvc16 N-terminal domain/Carboxypeptidase regulatory-like domain